MLKKSLSLLITKANGTNFDFQIFTMDIHEPERKLKLIWDFRGPDGDRTAKHHALHLKEFRDNRSLKLDIIGQEQLSEMHHLAYMVVFESEMPEVRDALKPHRGQLYSE